MCARVCARAAAAAGEEVASRAADGTSRAAFNIGTGGATTGTSGANNLVDLTGHAADLLIKHDNTFGTPEEDAFRRDFTINALFYDIANFSIIDYVGGLKDLKDGLLRCIGDPNDRFQEDPVRMLRAIVMASRLGFRIDEPVIKAIAKHRGLMATASPARLIEEYYKILRSGAAEVTFRALVEHRLLEPVTPEIQRGAKNVALSSAGSMCLMIGMLSSEPRPLNTLTNFASSR